MSSACMGGCRDCPARRAITAADADEDGAGYSLWVTLTNGNALHGAPRRLRGDGVLELVEYTGDGKLQSETPTYVRCRDISAVTVEW